MSLKTKILAAFTLLTLLLVGVGFVAVRMADQVEAAVARLNDETGPCVVALNQIAVAWITAEHTALHGTLLVSEIQRNPSRASDLEEELADEQRTFEAASVELAQWIDEYDRVSEDPSEAEYAFGFLALRQEIEAAWRRTLALKTQGVSAPGISKARLEIEATGEAFKNLVKIAIGDAVGEFREGRAAIDLAITKQAAANLIAIMFALGAALVVSLRVTGVIVNPIKRLEQAAIEVGHGHLDTRFESASRDELGALGDAFNRMVLDLSRTTVSRSYLDNIVHSMADILIVVDSEGKIARTNKAVTEVLDYQQMDLLGQSVDHLMGGGTFEAIILGGLKHRAYLRDVEGTLRARDGREVPVLLSGARIQDERGEGQQGIVCTAKDISDRKRDEQQIREMAYYDGLTGFPNRWFFQKRLSSALEWARRESQAVALLYIDLDRFKSVNDTLGHNMGDRLLCLVAKRLSEKVRLGDFLGRPGSNEGETPLACLGGDEFAILLTKISRPLDASIVAMRVRGALAEPFELGTQELFVTASIGIAVYPADGHDADTLLRNADTAMHHAKGSGKNTWQRFETSMNVAVSRKLRLEGHLRRALERQELSLHYQPLREATSGRVVAVEALLRWTNPEVGPVTPLEFIPVAEESGLIVPIGEWVLRTACAQARAWQDAGFRPIRLSVNVSSHQFRQPELMETVAQILEENRLSVADLELEITESTIMQEDAETKAAVQKLSDMGVGLALDDFGTGYSSLSYLRRFPFDRVKIDRSFVTEITASQSASALVTAIISMAHSLGLKVIAEGVETEAQAEHLGARGCDEFQGYLFGRPVPPEEFVRFLEREKDPEPWEM